MADLESLQSLLDAAKTESSDSLDSHLAKLFCKLLYDRPSNLLQSFEVYSQDIKLNGLEGSNPLLQDHIRSCIDSLTPSLTEALKFIDKPKEENEDGVLVEVPQDVLPYIPDLSTERSLLQWAGIDLGEEECFLLQIALKKLVKDKGAKDIRVWGKVLGIQQNYYVIEGTSEGAEEDDEEKAPDFEKRGEGVNALTYWVITSPFKEWVELPDVTPAQIKAARHIKKLFTGNVEAPVVSNPYFPGKEKHLLRAQIARITHSAYIIPKGGYKVLEDTPNEIEAEEEPVSLTTDQLGVLENWVHYHPSILKAARIIHMDPEIPDDVDIDPDELKAQIMAEDPSEPRLKSLDEDSALPEIGAAWAIRMVGDCQEFSDLPPKTGKVKYAVNVLRSLWWPGHVTVHLNGEWMNFYMGDGLKASIAKYYPASPPVLIDDPDDPQEQPDPFPAEPPKAEEDQPEDN